MKKFFIPITAALLVLCLALFAACGADGADSGITNESNNGYTADDGNGDSSNPEPEPEPEPEATKTLSYSSVDGGLEVTGDNGDSTDIVIPDEHEGIPVVGIGESAFAYSRHRTDINSVTIPDSVEEIGKNAFNNQDALITVNIGVDSNLKSIGSNAFSGCSALKSFYLPASCLRLGYDATPASFANKDSDYIDSYGEVFNACGALESFTVAVENTVFASMGGHLVCIGGAHNAEGKIILIRGVNVPEIPDGVEEIGKAAFREATVEALYIPASVTKIGNYFADNSAIALICFAGPDNVWSGVTKANLWDYNAEFTVTYDAASPASAANNGLA